MFGRGILFFLIVFILLSCARPKYESEQDPQVQESSTTCQFRFSKQNICGAIQWEKKQTEEEAGTFIVHFWPVEKDFDLEAFLWMPSMGHPSDDVEIKKAGLGFFRVEKVWFSMPGKWEIHFRSKSQDKMIDEAVYNTQF